MSKGKEKVVEVGDDELGFLPSLPADFAFDPGIPLEPIRSSVGTSARRMSPQTTSSSDSSDEEGSSGSENTLSEGQGDDSSEASPSGASRPEERGTVGGRALSRDYAIDYMSCTTTFDELNDLRLRYSIPGEIPLRIPGKKDTPSRPPRGHVTLYLESFKYGLRCPLQPYFARILNGLNLAPGQLNPNGWRVLSVSWGVHFPLRPGLLKRVEAVLANSCSSRELLSTYNFLESRLILPGHKMEDAVIGALTRKRSRPPTTDRDQDKDAPAAKRKNIVQQVPPLQALPPTSARVGESSRAATDPASSSPPVVPRSRLPDSRPEHLVPYLNELSKLVSKKDLEGFDGCTLGELVGAMQYSAFHLSCMATYYKAKVGRYDRKMKEDIQSATTRADVAEKKAGELNVENLKLIEQESLAQAKAITLEEELTKVKEDLQGQRAMYEAQLESLRDSHRAHVENLEREADNQYDQGLRHSYRCIMAVLGKQHPDLKMDDLAAGVAQHMDEEAAKEDAEGLEPIVIEEGNSPPRAVPADVGEASTPPDATGDTPPAPEEVQPTDAARLTDPPSF
ncbi:uncharacterized protein LOC127898831 [Citrus sinensis]|uniref:uncharacterized protein LOC112096968 n=1 Tax=Citrus clementina TaxID=85681 RepID=UPI000CED5A12|nr:uncharacterized protein LOC112096968 [Citrus x clementina]XP_052287281.1 uncharacterized protein LOC127898831 [Citrus sinensis]